MTISSCLYASCLPRIRISLADEKGIVVVDSATDFVLQLDVHLVLTDLFR